jgi:hypothetical protein
MSDDYQANMNGDRAVIALETEMAMQEAPPEQFTPTPDIPPNYNPMRVCRSLEITTPAMSALASPEERMRLEAVVMRGKQFDQNTVLSVQFMGGSSSQHRTVQTTIDTNIVPLINLRFEWGVAQGDVRIAFDPNDGAWSHIGTTIFQISPTKPTMNLGWLDMDKENAVIIHEFMHLLGHAHEHASPARDIAWEWDIPNVTKSLSGPPNFWDEETIQNNVLATMDENMVSYSDFDPESIMLYIFPVSWTVCRCVSSQPNLRMSATDKEWLSAYYPPDGSAPYVPRGPSNPGGEETGELVVGDDGTATSTTGSKTTSNGTTSTTTNTSTTSTTTGGTTTTTGGTTTTTTTGGTTTTGTGTTGTGTTGTTTTITDPRYSASMKCDAITSNNPVNCQITDLKQVAGNNMWSTGRLWTEPEFIALWVMIGLIFLLALICLIVSIRRRRK